MSVISKLAIPLLSAGLILSGCSGEDKKSSEGIEGKVSSVQNGGSSLRKNGWMRKVFHSRKEYVEDFAGLNMKMILVPGDVVSMPDGSSKYVEDFYIGETEVSVNQFLSFLEISRYDPKDGNIGLSKSGPGSFLDKDFNLPVTGTSVRNAEHMARYLSMRTGRNYSLPSLSEQILASFGPRFGFDGLPDNLTPKNANLFWGDSSDLLPVKSLEPNIHGLYHMIGNAGELAVVDQDPDEIKRGSGRGREGIAHDGRMFSISPSSRTSREAFEKDYSGQEPALDLVRSMGHYSLDYVSPRNTGFRLVSRPKKED